jgi:hypothetical protein
MYTTILTTPTGCFIQALVNAQPTITLMQQLSEDGHPAVDALPDLLPANLANRFKRLAGHLVRLVMLENGYVLLPKRRRCKPGSLFKRGACYRRWQ